MNINGIGLGLMIGQQIVQQFGGIITVDSEPDIGSTFIFQFKLENREEMFIETFSGQKNEFMLNSNQLQFKWKPSNKSVNNSLI